MAAKWAGPVRPEEPEDHRLRQREIVPARDDFASAFLFQFTAGVAGKMEFQTNALSPAFPQERGNRSPTMCRSNAPGYSKSHKFDNMEAATAILTDDLSRNAIMLSLSSGERAGVRASVSTFINTVETALRHFQQAFEWRFETQLTVMLSRNSMLVLVFLSLPKSSSIASTGGTPVSARRSRTILLSSSGW